MAAHDQLALVAFSARPACKAGGNDLLGQLIKLSLPFGNSSLDFSLEFGQRLASSARIEKVRRFGKRRSRQSRRDIEDTIFDLAVLRHKNGQRTLWLKSHEF